MLRSLYHTLLKFSYALRSARSPFIHFAPAGHFLSPLPDPAEIRRRAGEIFRTDVKAISGIDLRPSEQAALYQTLAAYLPEIPLHRPPAQALRFALSLYFGVGDAAILYAMLRHFRPQRVIEVGSGYSSAWMLDTAELFLQPAPHFTFIEPYPQRLYSLLRPADRQACTILEQPVQDVALSSFEALQANDLLFIDSSHVVKVGSDVQFLLAEVLPRLAPGVIVHFHDIPWPFEYPRSWFEQGIAWNEAYFLRTFLQYNSAFEVLFFNAYFAAQQPQQMGSPLPALLQDPGSGLWLRRRGTPPAR